jgi:hypothetical protein
MKKNYIIFCELLNLKQIFIIHCIYLSGAKIVTKTVTDTIVEAAPANTDTPPLGTRTGALITRTRAHGTRSTPHVTKTVTRSVPPMTRSGPPMTRSVPSMTRIVPLVTRIIRLVIRSGTKTSPLPVTKKKVHGRAIKK